jgi:GrpB-like predicted nucleotidyltransferase (UPF0157 family)
MASVNVAAKPGLDIISVRKVPHTVEIVEPDPTWPEVFEVQKQRITAALGAIAVNIQHVGSTSVPGLPAKPVIDIDLTVADIHDESAYVLALEKSGFQFLFREIPWDNHRFFADYEPFVNLHVWGHDSAELVRHRLFRDRLRRNAADREAYGRIKREASRATKEAGDGVAEYNERKGEVIRGILKSAYEDEGLEWDRK